MNAYLQQKSKLFRQIPKWMDKVLDHPALLRKVSVNAGMTSPQELGAITVSTLKGTGGFQKKEIEHLAKFLQSKEKPDVVMISNVLLVGLIPALKEKVDCKFVVTLQGEDTYLDSLPSEWSGQAWNLLEEHCKSVDLFLPVSKYYGKVMQQRLKISDDKIEAVYNGLDLSKYKKSSRPLGNPTLGMLGRLIADKGVDILTEAFIYIKDNNLIPGLKLTLAGSKLKSDEEFLEVIKDKLRVAGYFDDVEFKYNLTLEEKIDYLSSLTLFSTPAEYGESFGLYVLEAAASGLPMIQPDSAAFPELLKKLNTGLLYKTGDHISLAQKITECFENYTKYERQADSAMTKVKAEFTDDVMAEKIIGLLEEKLA